MFTRTRFIAVAAAALSLCACSTSSPTPISTPTITIDPTTCSSLLSPATLARFASIGFTNSSNDFTKLVASQPSLAVYPFLQYGGIVCDWGKDGAGFTAFAYGPITEAQAHVEATKWVAQGQLTAAKGTFDVFGSANSTARIAFGTNFWAYSFDSGGGDVLAEVIENAPAF